MAKKTNEPVTPAAEKPETQENEQVKADESGEQETVKEKQTQEAKTGETAVTEITDKSEVQKKEVETSKPQTATFITPYTQAYPGEKAFHVTSDRQVFLERDRGLAVLHQTSLSNGEKIVTIRVK